jgi:hypothetical protein
MTRSTRRVALLAVVFAAIQLIRVEHDNPPVELDFPAAPAVQSIIKRACYDCHSNETVWPWYSYVAPASWLVGHDVHGGRRELNFSTWNRLSPTEQSEVVQDIWKQVSEGEMPPWYYTMPLHSGARLSPGDKAVLELWAREMRPRPR